MLVPPPSTTLRAPSPAAPDVAVPHRHLVPARLVALLHPAVRRLTAATLDPLRSFAVLDSFDALDTLRRRVRLRTIRLGAPGAVGAAAVHAAAGVSAVDVAIRVWLGHVTANVRVGRTRATAAAGGATTFVHAAITGEGVSRYWWIRDDDRDGRCPRRVCAMMTLVGALQPSARS
jgi:hypothetical protein